MYKTVKIEGFRNRDNFHIFGFYVLFLAYMCLLFFYIYTCCIFMLNTSLYLWNIFTFKSTNLKIAGVRKLRQFHMFWCDIYGYSIFTYCIFTFNTVLCLWNIFTFKGINLKIAGVRNRDINIYFVFVFMVCYGICVLIFCIFSLNTSR